MKSLVFGVGVILIGLVIFAYTEAWGEDWKYFGTGGDGIFWWYDPQGLTNQPSRIIHVWVKKVKASEIKDMVERGKKVTLYELEQMTLESDYERSLMEIDCAGKTINIRQKCNYDAKGILKSGESIPGAKQSIPTDSVAEILYKAVCK